jgi:hypothetical protein
MLMPKRTDKTKMQALLALGQSGWLDYLSRGMARPATSTLIDDGLRGMTSNPTIFEHAIGRTDDSDAALSTLASSSGIQARGGSALELRGRVAIASVAYATFPRLAPSMTFACGIRARPAARRHRFGCDTP